MKARWLLIAVISTFAYGQGVFYSSNATQAASNVPPGAAGPLYTVPNALVTVCSYPASGDPCTNQVDVFTDQDLAPSHKITQPIHADALGRYSFWVAPGVYSQSIQTQSGVSKGTYPLTLTSPQGPQGPPGIGCGAGFSQCIVETPSGNQTITQPAGTTLSVNSLNNVFNATTFPGSDIGEQITNGFASSACNNSCTIMIPPGTYYFSHNIDIPSKYDSLIGSALGTTILRFTGSGGDVIYWHHPTFDVFSGTGKISDITLLGNSNASDCMHIAGFGAVTLKNMSIGGCQGNSGVGLEFEDVTLPDTRHPDTMVHTWMERVNVKNVEVGYVGLYDGGENYTGAGNTTDVWFHNNGGTGSFDYSDFEFKLQVNCNGKGILIDSGTDLLGVKLSAQGNLSGCDGGGDTAEALSVKGLLRYASGFVRLEGSDTPNAYHVYNGGTVLFNGTISGWINGKNPVPVVDAGGFYQAHPYMDFSYPNGNPDGLGNFSSFVQRASLNITSDGTIVLTAGNNISGIYDLVWPGDNGRFQDLLFSVSCSPFGNKTCDITTLSNQSITNPPVFSNLRVTAGSSQPIPHLLVDISNRNVLPQNIYFTELAGSPNILFPTDNADSTVVSKEGLTVRSTGSSASDGLTWGNSSHSIIPSSDNVIWTNDGAPAAGACTPTNSINVFYNGQSIRIPTC